MSENLFANIQSTYTLHGELRFAFAILSLKEDFQRDSHIEYIFSAGSLA